MVGSKLIALIKTLDSRELNRLEVFINSPIFNRNEKIIRLFDIIKSNYPSFDKDDFTRENVYKAIFPEKENKDSSLRSLMTQLTKLIHDFLCTIRFFPQRAVIIMT